MKRRHVGIAIVLTVGFAGVMLLPPCRPRQAPVDHLPPNNYNDRLDDSYFKREGPGEPFDRGVRFEGALAPK